MKNAIFLKYNIQQDTIKNSQRDTVPKPDFRLNHDTLKKTQRDSFQKNTYTPAKQHISPADTIPLSATEPDSISYIFFQLAQKKSEKPVFAEILEHNPPAPPSRKETPAAEAQESSTENNRQQQENQALPQPIEQTPADTLSQTRQPLANDSFLALEKDNPLYGKDWIAAVLLFVLFVVAWLRFVNPKYLSTLPQAILRFGESRKYRKESNILSLRTALMLRIVFSLYVGLFLFLAFKFYEIETLALNDFWRYLIFSGFIFFIYEIKRFFFNTIGFISSARNISGEYMFNVFLLNQGLGLVLIPVVVALPFVSEQFTHLLIITGFVLIGFFYLFRIFRGIQIIVDKHISILYLILYLCTLEILPLLMLIKLLSNNLIA